MYFNFLKPNFLKIYKIISISLILNLAISTNTNYEWYIKDCVTYLLTKTENKFQNSMEGIIGRLSFQIIPMQNFMSLKTFQRVMINCSKFICSKKLVDTIFHLLDTIRANVIFFSTGQKSKIICRTCISSSFTFRQKNINCSNCNWLG